MGKCRECRARTEPSSSVLFFPVRVLVRLFLMVSENDFFLALFESVMLTRGRVLSGGRVL